MIGKNAAPEAPMNRADWLLLLLGLPEEDGSAPPAMDRVRVVKSLFVLGKRFTIPDYYNFQPYNYGPFDSAVYTDAETMAGTGLVEQINGRYVSYAATEAGKARAAQIGAQVNPAFKDQLLAVRRWANNVDFQTLVRAIYNEWPETRVNSIFRG